MDEDRSILIIANPVSGRGKHARMAELVATILKEDGVNVRMQFTTHPGHAESIARESIALEMCDQSDNPTCIAACGGDGTIQEVAHVLATQKEKLGDACPALGLIPSGRCNDFARAMGISTDPVAIAKILTGGKAKSIDLGKVNDRFFCTVATVGIDAEITSYVDHMRVPLTGTMAYLYGAMCVLATYKPRALKISGDFGCFDHPVFLASSANTSSYGGAIPIAPQADCTDGMLDLCLIDYVSKFRALQLIPKILKGQHIQQPGVRFVRTSRIEVDAPTPLELWADGERMGHTPAVIEAVPAAIQVLVG